MKIYGVRIGDIHEGGTVKNPLFRLEKDAIMEASAIANRWNQDKLSEYVLQPNGKVWRDMYDYIEVCEFELI